MPKPMLRQPQAQTQTPSASLLSAVQQQGQKQQTQQMDKMKLDRLLRKTRSKAYMEMMTTLDAGGHVHNQQRVNEIIDKIREEFPEVEIRGVMLGVVSVCYLGKPYEVHTLDIAGKIVEHYQAGHKLPNGMEKARALALRGGYSFIEVYVDCCRCVSSTGAVSVVPC